ncbi:MAG: hypothetical protein MRZ36_02205 [Eubacterium sp.]|nr:hypothetical protein [Eubacterium sp.]
MKNKIIKSIIAIAICCFFATVTVNAASYTGSYDMKGGIFCKKAINVKNKLTITVFPQNGSADCNMGIYTATKSWLWGWSGCDFIANVSSVQKSSSTYKKKGTIDGLYFRNWSGKRWTGKFTLSY